MSSVSLGMALDSVTNQLQFSCDNTRKEVLQAVFKIPRRRQRKKEKKRPLAGLLLETSVDAVVVAVLSELYFHKTKNGTEGFSP